MIIFQAICWIMKLFSRWIFTRLLVSLNINSLKQMWEHVELQWKFHFRGNKMKYLPFLWTKYFIPFLNFLRRKVCFYDVALSVDESNSRYLALKVSKYILCRIIHNNFLECNEDDRKSMKPFQFAFFRHFLINLLFRISVWLPKLSKASPLLFKGRTVEIFF